MGEYATPVDVITGPNAIDNPTAYTTPASVHYVKQSNASQTIDRNTARHSQMQDYEQNFASSSGVVEPQHYETALSVQSDNPLLDGTQAYEEPIDSILHYQNSQEEIQAVQQQYEVPLRTSSHGDQGKWHHHHQAIKPSTSFPVPGDKGKQEEKLPTYTSLHPGTMSEPQPYTPVNRTPSPGFYSTPSEQTKQANSTTLTTPQENHHYFVLDKGQHEKQQRSGKDPLYFVLESGNQKEESTKQGAFKNGHHDSVGTVTNADERIYYELEEHESNAPTLGPRKGSHLGTDGHAYFILERK